MRTPRPERRLERSRNPLSRSTTRLLAGVVAIAAIFLVGCGPHRVKVDYTNFEKAYAETSSKEVLLNLARLENRDPTYFFKLGQISTSYRMSASLSATGALTPQGTVPGGALATGGGTPGMVLENDPAFTFIPVDDATNAQLLLKPVPAEVFYDLYQQGWRVDQLFRLMVDRIELTLPAEHGNGCRVEIIRNVPPPAYKDSTGKVYTDYSREQQTLSRYATFLRVSAVVYALQKHGMLLLKGSTTFEPLDKNSGMPAETPLAPVPPNSPDKPAAATKDVSAPAAKDVNDASAKGQVWELDPKDNKWYLGTKVTRTRFQLSSINGEDTVTPTESTYGENVSDIEKYLRSEFAQDDSLKELANAPELTDILEILYSGFAIEGSSTDPESEKGPCPDQASGTVSSHLVMRSLIGLMAAAAQEQDSFDMLTTDPKAEISLKQDNLIQDIHADLFKVTKATQESPENLAREQAMKSIDEVPFNALVPSIERLPVLRLSWPTNTHVAQPYTDVSYKRGYYLITDRADLQSVPEKEYALENGFWNRDTFRLICELSAQVTVDISKFPLPEILQLRTE